MVDTYDKIDRPFDSLLSRGQANESIMVDRSLQTSEDAFKNQSAAFKTSVVNAKELIAKNTIDGSLLDNVWLNTFIRSRNFKPQVLGFTLNGLTGEVEFNNIGQLMLREGADIILQSNGSFANEAEIKFFDLDNNKTQASLYEELGGAGKIVIEPTGSEGGVSLTFGEGSKYNFRFLTIYNEAVDEFVARATSGANNSYMLIEPSLVTFNVAAAGSTIKFAKDSSDTVLRFSNLSAVPATGTIGDVCVANTKLYICTTTNNFTIVGTQT